VDGGTVALLVGLDAVSALAVCVVALWFFRVWAATRAPLHLLYGVGLLISGASYATVAASHYDLGRTPDLWDQLRFAGQLGGPLVLVCAYVSRRYGDIARPARALGWTVVALATLDAAYWLLYPPLLSWGSVEESFLPLHVSTMVLWALCGWFAYRGGSAARSDPRRLFVPAAFLCIALSKYTWALADVSRDERLVFLIYPWRLAAVALLVAALADAPVARPEVPTHVSS
jgi:hypothetical protein